MGYADRPSAMHKFQSSQWLPLPREQVFLFFADPRNLPRVSPPSSGARITRLDIVPPPEPPISGLAGAGSEVAISLRVVPFLPLRFTWIAVITEFRYPEYFADIHRGGPFRHWQHRHEFSEESRDGRPGTLILDLIQYEVGFGVLGKLASAVLVRHQLEGVFAYRRRLIEVLLAEPEKPA